MALARGHVQDLRVVPLAPRVLLVVAVREAHGHVSPERGAVRRDVRIGRNVGRVRRVRVHVLEGFPHGPRLLPRQGQALLRLRFLVELVVRLPVVVGHVVLVVRRVELVDRGFVSLQERLRQLVREFDLVVVVELRVDPVQRPEPGGGDESSLRVEETWRTSSVRTSGTASKATKSRYDADVDGSLALSKRG